MKTQNIRDYRWGTSIPVIRSVMEYFNPIGILELGAGRNSTPVFYEYNKNLTSIESDKKWIEVVKETIPERDNFKIIHHDLGNYKRSSNNIDQKIKDQFIEHCKKFISTYIDFLFVDHVAGLRVLSIISLMEYFKYIVYHDAEDKVYGYNALSKDITKNFIHILNRTPHVHTGILVKNEYSSEIENFINLLDKYNIIYCSKFDVPYIKDIIIL